MTEERKYQEEEIKEILGLAVRSEQVGPLSIPDERGLTLAEIQDVGREVGVEPGRIARAALALEARRELLPRGRFVGIPVSVGRTIDLPRDVTDREWAVLVGELRATFGARGEVTEHGGIREWSNGNLHAFLEPTATGTRLRLTTRKGNASAMITTGAAGVVLGLALLTLFIFEDLGRASLVIPALMAAFGGGTVVSSMLRLPRWAGEREGQMNHIADRVAALLEESPPDESAS